MNTHKPTLLIVEDDRSMHGLMLALLGDNPSYVIEIAETLEEAYEKYRAIRNCFMLIADGKLPRFKNEKGGKPNATTTEGFIEEFTKKFPRCTKVRTSTDPDINKKQLQQGCDKSIDKRVESGTMITDLDAIAELIIKILGEGHQQAA